MVAVVDAHVDVVALEVREGCGRPRRRRDSSCQKSGWLHHLGDDGWDDGQVFVFIGVALCSLLFGGSGRVCGLGITKGGAGLNAKFKM